VGETTEEGDYDEFLPLANVSGPGGYFLPGNDTKSLQRINVYANGTDTGNATSYLVPTSGLTIVSDIDDILRVTKI
jgi:phosphatidate phosphatase APP1